MDITNPQRAKVLVHALPYIQEYSGKIVVIKYGGNAMISEKLKDSVMRDIVLLSLIGVQVVLVHGGGPEITDMLQKLGKQTQFVDGLRVTDAETADVVQMVLAGKINKTLVNLIGQNAFLFLSGAAIPSQKQVNSCHAQQNEQRLKGKLERGPQFRAEPRQPVLFFDQFGRIKGPLTRLTSTDVVGHGHVPPGVADNPRTLLR